MKALFAGLAALILTAVPAHAQLGVYAGFSTSKLDLANTNRTNGGTFGLFYDSHHFPLLNFGLDLRAIVAHSDEMTKVTSGLGGPRVVVHLPLIPLKAYAEGLVGAAHVQSGQGVAQYDGTALAAGAAVGADLTILPYISWRVIDYNYNRLTGPASNQSTLTTGLVIRIPFS